MSKKGKFLLGAGVGLGLGLLFAPKSGDETRKELKAKIADLYEKIKHIDAEDVKDSITEKLTELQTELKSLDKEKVKQIAIEKAGNIKKKAEDLVKIAVDKGTPAVQKAAKEVKDATVVALKKLTEKIEQPEKIETTKKTEK